MSININVNGTDYPVPTSAADTTWAAKTVAFWQALAAYANTLGTTATALAATVAALAVTVANLATAVGARAWTDAVYANAWVANAPGLKHQKDNTGRVWFRGGAALGVSGTVACQLPVGQRPTDTVRLVATCSGGCAEIVIDTDGNVTPTNQTAGADVASYVVLDGLSFTTNA